MLWFNKSRRSETNLKHEIDSQRSSVEVIAHKRATKRTIAQTKKVSRQLNDLFDENGVTLQIKIAVGGKH